MGATDDDTATSRLRLLRRDFLEHPRTGPGPRACAPVVPGTPVNLDVVDHITAAVQEVVDDTLAVNPKARPLPADRIEAVYAWYVANTANAAPAQAQRRDTIIYRQRLEHALAMGDASVIPPHRCPACNTFGLRWQTAMRRALCTNRRCLTKDGMSNTWTLARLAYEHVAAEKSLRVRAT